VRLGVEIVREVRFSVRCNFSANPWRAMHGPLTCLGQSANLEMFQLSSFYKNLFQDIYKSKAYYTRGEERCQAKILWRAVTPGL
jgi:hypothetical protein